jgi:pimeloyl-ACP methyl ester carboxylesterase
MWPMWQGLADIPVLTVRGAISDILSTQTLRRMAELHPRMQSVTVSNVGHAPMLDEPEALAAINAFLAAL